MPRTRLTEQEAWSIYRMVVDLYKARRAEVVYDRGFPRVIASFKNNNMVVISSVERWEEFIDQMGAAA